MAGRAGTPRAPSACGSLGRRGVGCRGATDRRALCGPMTKSIRIDAEADDEIWHAIDRYERKREGLGAEFWDELKAAMRTLEAPGPECGPVIGLPREFGVRRKLLARFPYAIVFVENDTFVRVISVMLVIAA